MVFISVCYPLTGFKAEPLWKAKALGLGEGGVFLLLLLISSEPIWSCYLFIHFHVASGASLLDSLNPQWLSRTPGRGAYCRVNRGFLLAQGNRGATPTLSGPYLSAPPPCRKGGTTPPPAILSFSYLGKNTPNILRFLAVKETSNRTKRFKQ